MAGAVVFSHIFNGWSLPLFAKDRLINSGLYFVVILEVLPVLIHAEKKIVFTDWVSWSKVFGDGLEFDRSIGENSSVAVDVVTNFYVFFSFGVNYLHDFPMLLIRPISIHGYIYSSFLDDVDSSLLACNHLVRRKDPFL